MAYRFTDTEKWRDKWFSELSQIEMLLFMYLCDVCDIAGIAEVNLRLWAFELGSTESTIKGALEGLKKSVLFSKCGEYIYLKNFLKHQKNLPLNLRNNAHRGIIGRFEANLDKFIDVKKEVDICLINSFIASPCQGAKKGLASPPGKGNGKGNGKGKKESMRENKKKEKTYDLPEDWFLLLQNWLTYKSDRKESYKSDMGIKKFITKLKRLSDDNIETATAIIDQSMANNWAGIFELKNNTSRRSNQSSSATTDEELAAAIQQGMARGIAENQTPGW